MMTLLLAASLWQPAVVYGAAVGADTASTLYTWDRYERFGHQGPVDANPLLHSRRALVGWQAFRYGALVGTDVWLQKKGHRGAARFLRVGTVALSGYLTYRNIRNGWKAGR